MPGEQRPASSVAGSMSTLLEEGVVLWDVLRTVISSSPLPALDDVLPALGVWLWLGVAGVTLSCMTERQRLVQ